MLSCIVFLLIGFTFAAPPQAAPQPVADQPPAALAGAWVAFQDDDDPSKEPTETLYLYPDGTLKIKGQPSAGFGYRTDGNAFQFVMLLDDGPQVVGSRDYVLEGDIFKLKNAKQGYIHYRRSDEPLPPLPGTSSAMAMHEFGPFSFEKPENWGATEQITEDGSQIMVNSPDGLGILMMTFIEKDPSKPIDLNDVTPEMAMNLIENLNLPSDNLEKVTDGAFYHLSGPYLRIWQDVENARVEIKLKTVMVEAGRYLALGTMSVVDSPADSTLGNIIRTIKVNDKAIR